MKINLTKIAIFALLIVLTGGRSWGQVSGYIFSQSMGTYTPITGTTALGATTTGWDDNQSPAAGLTIPFGFTFNGVSYSTVRVGSNGFLVFGTTAAGTANYTPISATNAYPGAVAVFARDLVDGTAGNAVVYNTIGTAPNRQFVVQWTNARRYNSGAVVGDVLNFQIILNEGGGVAANQTVQLVYGTNTATSATALTVQVGLRGATNTDYNDRTTTTSWSASTPGGSNAATMTTSNTVMPASGLTYTWAPPSCSAPSGISATALSATTGSVTFTTNGATNYIVEYGVAPFTPGTGAAAGGGTAVSTTTSPVSITGLAANTTYTVYVRSNCSGSYSANSGAVTFTTLCSPTAVPVTEGFNAATLPACWNKAIVAVQTASKITFVTTGSYPTTSPYEGTYMVQYNAFSSTGGSAGSEERLISLPLNTTGAPSVDVNFYWRNENSADYGTGAYLNEGVTVQYSTNGTAWTDVQFFARQDATLASGTAAWKLKTVTLPAAAGNQSQVYVAFKFHSEYGDNMFLDLASIAATPACSAPSAVAATINSPTSASISFTSPGTGFIVEYGATGFTPGTGATAGTGGTVVTGSASPITLTGLTPSTAYQAYVRQVCAGSTYSPNSAVVAFTTPPSNDNCAGATTLTPGATCVTTAGTTVNATTSTAPAATTCAATGVSNDVFYAFTANGTDGYDITVTPASGRYSIILYSGACASLTQVACIEGTAGNPVTLSAGTLPAGTYTYRLYARNGVTSTFTTCVTISQPLTVGTITATQQTGDLTAGTTNNNILRVEIPTTGTLGTQTISSVTVNYTGTNAADIAASGVTLWTGTATAPTTQIGTAQSFSGGTATFSGLSTNLTANGTTYLWVRLNTAATTTFANTVDVSIPAGGIVINAAGGATPAGTRPPTALNPAGVRQFGYCTPSAISVDGTGITNVTFGSAPNVVNNTTGSESATGYYGNYSAQVGNVQAGVSAPVSITFSTGYTYNYNLYVDLNNDGDFVDAGETVATGESAAPNPTTVTANITLPVATSLGNHRLRIASGDEGAPAPCATGGEYQAFEDYTINVTAPPACSPVTGVSANPTSTTTASVSFTGTSGNYIVEYGATGFTPGTGATAGTGGTVVTATSSPVTLNGLTANTNYQVYVRQVCTGPVYSPNTGTTLFTGYCTPSATSVDGTGITNVTFGTSPNVVNNTTGNESATGYYGNYSAQVGDVQLTVPTAISIRFSTGYTYNYNIYVDLNNDLDFTDAGEILATGESAAPNPTTVTPTITIPSGTSLGNHRLRIASGDDGAPAPCATGGTYQAFEDYTINVVPAPTCFPPTAVAASNTTSTTTDFSFTAPTTGTPTNYQYEVRSSGTPGSGPTGLAASGTTTGTTVTGITGLTANTNYTIYVRSFCGGTDFSSYAFGAFTTPIVNDNAAGAITITVGATCTGAPFSNANASASVGEPVPSCANSATGYRTVWYKFVAPSGGAVRVSTDYSGGTLDDTRMALYSADNPANYATFTSIACDDDNGVVNGSRALLYAADLVPGATYYVEVDNYSSGNGGTYCLTVDAVTSAMLVPSGTCVPLTTTGGNAYTGYRSLVSATGQLGALVRQAAGTTGTAYTSAVTVNSGAVRSNTAAYSNIYYLDRNFLLNSTSNTPGDVKLFFTTAELNALTNQPGSNVEGISDLAITRQTGSTCQANYASANGTETTLTASTSGSTGGVSWLSFTTPGFSNFYISPSANALPVEIVSINAENAGATNRVTWTSGVEMNVANYEVEKSRDGQDFEPLQTVNAQGNNSRYVSVDNAPYAGLTYYRVRSVDADGTYSYSKTVSAFMSGNGEAAIQAFPNPMSSVLTVTVYGAQGGDVQLTDLSGRVVSSTTVTNGQATFNTQSLNAGIYFVKWTNGSMVKTLKVTKQ